ncbi:MAG: ACT domain-containing protein [Acidobacteria bacterium]|nr:ACT domain-containing protein [Acidobacteriota bacterium]
MAILKQITVFLENVPGRLATLCNALEQRGVNLQAMTTSEASEYGVVRMIVDDVDAAIEALRQVDLPFSTVDVLGIEVSDEPGALGKVAVQLAEAGLNVDYAYVTVASQSGNALCIFKVADPRQAETILTSA